MHRRRSRDERRERRSDRPGREENPQRRQRTSRAGQSSGNGSSAKRDGDSRLKFYLELSSPVVDAPSIGGSMAKSLEDVGVVTVNDLLAADAEDLATDLGQPRVTGSVIRAWQDQSRLVCRIPNLRGHDAQILVACGITTPEALNRMEPPRCSPKPLRLPPARKANASSAAARRQIWPRSKSGSVGPPTAAT